MLSFLVLGTFIILAINGQQNSTVPKIVFVTLGQKAIIPLPKVANYRRVITKDDQICDEQIFSVCNGNKNKKKCGFWKSVQTKKKIPSGATNYNKELQALVVQNMTKSDLGIYMTGNRKVSITVTLVSG